MHASLEREKVSSLAAKSRGSPSRGCSHRDVNAVDAVRFATTLRLYYDIRLARHSRYRYATTLNGLFFHRRPTTSE